jgi:hypothetical protein
MLYFARTHNFFAGEKINTTLVDHAKHGGGGAVASSVELAAGRTPSFLVLSNFGWVVPPVARRLR